MGIEVTGNDLIPFLSKGSMVFFTTRYPSDDDLNMYPHIVVTSDTPWDPHGLVMPGGLGVTDDIANDRMTQQVTSNTFRSDL